jgi:hypothetical protein
MSYSENGGTQFTMPVAPYGGGYGNDGFGFGGNGAWWLIILLLFANNGWGNGFGFGGGFGGGMMPWMLNNTTNNDVQRGFDQSAIMGSLNGITGAINNGFANAEISRCNAQANVLQTLNANQAATLQSMNTLSMGLQNCCCENRAGLADLKYTVATENCADRTALSEGLTSMMMANNTNTQNLMNTVNSGIQTVMDKICALELAGKDQQIAALTAQLNEANRRASQNDQTAQILAGQRALANEVEQYVMPTPRPAWIVQNPSCCNQNSGCGCGCAA